MKFLYVFLACSVVLNYRQRRKMGLKCAATEGARHDRENNVVISMD